MGDDVTYRAVGFDALPDWQKDDHAQALSVFLSTCDLIDMGQTVAPINLQPLCDLAKTAPDPKQFFESNFQPVIVGGRVSAHFTGYYEPVVNGSRKRGGAYQTPLYRTPPDLTFGQKYHSRAEIDDGALDDRGLELVWLDDPIAAFFIQVQGSACIRLDTGAQIRLGFDAKNGHRYKSIGQEMIRRGLLPTAHVTADAIMDWLRNHPDQRQDIMDFNPSYIFFREQNLHDTDGPIGAMGRPISAGRSIAIDPQYNPLGLPIYIDKVGDNPMRRLMIAQDVGSAIIGPQRGDLYFGTGNDAGQVAGSVNDTGQMYLLLPNAAAAKMKLADET